MNNSPVFSKKPSVCRYFASNGQCFYGDNCQFTHLKTDERNDEPNNGDAFFNATFKNLQTHFDRSEYPSEQIKEAFAPNGINPSALEFVPTSANSPARSCCNGYHGNESNADDPNHLNVITDTENYAIPTYTKSTTQTRKESKSPVFSIQENVGGTTYFYSSMEQNNEHHSVVIPNYTMHSGELPHITHTKHKMNMPATLTNNQLKSEILTRQAFIAAGPNYSDPDTPTEIDSYHCLCPLEPKRKSNDKSNSFGYVTSLYKANNINDGLHYCLRRIHGFRLSNTKCMPIIEIWKKLTHSNIIHLYEVFTTKAFGDHSIIFVYDYHPHSFTVLEHHFGNSSNHENIQLPYQKNNSASSSASSSSSSYKDSQEGLLPENIIWTYAVQLSSALRIIHAHHLACRVLDPSKILVTSKARLRLNCVGIFDCIATNTGSNAMHHYQQDDLQCLGRILLAFASNSVKALKRENLHNSMQAISHNYSADLKNLILFLTSNPSRSKSINDVMPMIGARFYVQLDCIQMQLDSLENQLSMEIENGRLFRLVSKLGAINERPEYGIDIAWSETGDRYILKLFRDYLFHQVDSQGKPWFDMAHIVMNLNKLDAGVHEKICLMSRDEQSVMIVSYEELKRCLETSFNELLPLTC